MVVAAPVVMVVRMSPPAGRVEDEGAGGLVWRCDVHSGGFSSAVEDHGGTWAVYCCDFHAGDGFFLLLLFPR